jgi:spore coat polysaccharide biosynthesis protein SpsF
VQNNAPKIITVVQARMSSTRLPAKVMMSLAGKPLLARMVERVAMSPFVGKIVVAATVDPADDPIVELCEREGVETFRGDPDDLLDRHYQAGAAYGADAVAKIPSDVPLICPTAITRAFKYYIDNADRFDYVSNLHPATYPDGNDVEIMSMDALRQAWTEAERKFEREHTTPHLWENPDRFRIGNVWWEAGLDYSMTHRWTIDYEEDYLFIKAVYDKLYKENPRFTLYDILRLLDREPEISEINAKYAGVNWYRHHLDELKTVASEQTRRIDE